MRAVQPGAQRARRSRRGDLGDPNAHVVHKFGADGKILLTLGEGVASDDTSRDAFNQPNGLGFAPNGDIYVSTATATPASSISPATASSSASSAARKDPRPVNCRSHTASPSTRRAASSSPTATTSGYHLRQGRKVGEGHRGTEPRRRRGDGRRHDLRQRRQRRRCPPFATIRSPT